MRSDWSWNKGGPFVLFMQVRPRGCSCPRLRDASSPNFIRGECTPKIHTLGTETSTASVQQSVYGRSTSSWYEYWPCIKTSIICTYTWVIWLNSLVHEYNRLIPRKQFHNKQCNGFNPIGLRAVSFGHPKIAKHSKAHVLCASSPTVLRERV